MSDWICSDVKCKLSGKDRDEGYPVCKHQEARKHCDKEGFDGTEEDFEDGIYPPQVCMHTCPLNLWRFSGDRRIPVAQSLLVEYQGD